MPVAVAMDLAARLRARRWAGRVVEDVEELVLRIGDRRRRQLRAFGSGSEALEHVLERAVGDQLLRELVAAGPHLALDDAVLAEPVLADPVEPGE